MMFSFGDRVNARERIRLARGLPMVGFEFMAGWFALPARASGMGQTDCGWASTNASLNSRPRFEKLSKRILPLRITLIERVIRLRVRDFQPPTEGLDSFGLDFQISGKAMGQGRVRAHQPVARN
jgi:hypothetical protein